MMPDELLDGESPFSGPLAAVVQSQVFDRPRASTAIPSPIMEIIWKATAKDPSQRFQSCEEFSGAFHYMPKPGAAQPPVEAISNELAVDEGGERPPAPPSTAGKKPAGVSPHT